MKSSRSSRSSNRFWYLSLISFLGFYFLFTLPPVVTLSISGPLFMETIHPILSPEWHFRSFGDPLSHGHSESKRMPRSSPSTLPRVILLVLQGRSFGNEDLCVFLIRDNPILMFILVFSVLLAKQRP
ncbi:hypothetical protein M430DRAFT_193540 [Amorphotheca resinae ATCC 22711]|uniref:Transmembrane protein n=1 Tax=Amorphotheca resinae ATCC 22711 TaxID=857342 RepID=A0A2T3AQ58_AMORE|nr:hypothetical protein M430DRAFT_193540 [Amorphotheca resinae ATCC 22711]PSS07143.1 hypothetical protein M430DRAFT_193540 [Amorphotheca resinae ATCC 22711]